VDLACSSVSFIRNKRCTFLESVDGFYHLFEAHVVHWRQAEVITRLPRRHPGGHDGIDGKNEVPLVFEGKDFRREGWLSSVTTAAVTMFIEMVRYWNWKKWAKWILFYYLLTFIQIMNCNAMIQQRSHCIAMQVLLETSSDKKPCHLKGPNKLFLWYFFLPISYWKELTKTIGENYCVILISAVIAEAAEITEMGEWRTSLFNWRDVNVGSEWGNEPFSAKRPDENTTLGGKTHTYLKMR
jgi:hypothetical protein